MLARAGVSARSASFVRSLSSNIPGATQLAALLKAQGHAVCDPTHRQGLHPLVMPLASATDGKEVIGVLRWPSFADEHVVVRTDRQPLHFEEGKAELSTLHLQPFGSLPQYARRAAAEADAASGCAEVIEAAAEVSGALTTPAYTAGELGATKLTLDQFLLLRVGPFPDVWEVGAAQAHPQTGTSCRWPRGCADSRSPSQHVGAAHGDDAAREGR